MNDNNPYGNYNLNELNGSEGNYNPLIQDNEDGEDSHDDEGNFIILYNNY